MPELSHSDGVDLAEAQEMRMPDLRFRQVSFQRLESNRAEESSMPLQMLEIIHSDSAFLAVNKSTGIFSTPETLFRGGLFAYIRVMEATKTIEELTRQIVELAHPVKVFLFGSAARGEAGFDSDIDLLVVMPDGSHRRHTAQRLYREISNIKTAFDLVVATTSDLDQYGETPGLIYQSALRDGRLLYAA